MDEKYMLIKSECLKSKSMNPIELAIQLMKMECISIHGHEHHILDGSCLLTALHNAGVEFDLDSALDEMIERGQKMPGATCGKWGVCGSAASMGAALAIIHGTGPLSDSKYYKENLKLVSQALAEIAKVGGPRCCKRNTFLSMQAAVDFVNAEYGIKLSKSKIICNFSDKNKQCISGRCPFFRGAVHE